MEEHKDSADNVSEEYCYPRQGSGGGYGPRELFCFLRTGYPLTYLYAVVNDPSIESKAVNKGQLQKESASLPQLPLTQQVANTQHSEPSFYV